MPYKVTSTYIGIRDEDLWVDADSAEDFRLRYVITPFIDEVHDTWSWLEFMKGNEDFVADKDNILRQRTPQNVTFDASTQIYTVDHIYDSEGSYEHYEAIAAERKSAIAALYNQYLQGLHSDSDTEEFNIQVQFRRQMYNKNLTIDSDYSG